MRKLAAVAIIIFVLPLAGCDDDSDNYPTITDLPTTQKPAPKPHAPKPPKHDKEDDP